MHKTGQHYLNLNLFTVRFLRPVSSLLAILMTAPLLLTPFTNIYAATDDGLQELTLPMDDTASDPTLPMDNALSNNMSDPTHEGFDVLHSTVATGNITLYALAKELVENDPEIMERLRSLKEVEKDLDIAFGEYLPVVDLDAAYKGASDDGSDFDFTKSFGVTVTQNLFNGFNTKYENRLQKSRLISAAYYVDELQDEKLLTLVEKYLNVIKGKEMLLLSKNNAESHSEHYHQIKEKVDSGFANQAESQQSESRFKLAESNYVIEQNNYMDTIAELERMANVRYEAEQLHLPTFAHPLPQSYEEALDIAYQVHPSMHVARENIQVREWEYEKSKNDYYPYLDLVGEYDWLETEQDGITATTDKYQIGLQATWNIFNGGRDTDTVQQNKIRILQKKSTLHNVEREIRERLRLAWNAYEKLGQQIDYLEKHVILSQQTKDTYLEEFNLGRRDMLDMLDAEKELTSAKESLLTAKYDYLLSKYRVLEGMGQLKKAFAQDGSDTMLATIDKQSGTKQTSSDASLTADASGLPELGAAPAVNQENHDMTARNDTDLFAKSDVMALPMDDVQANPEHAAVSFNEDKSSAKAGVADSSALKLDPMPESGLELSQGTSGGLMTKNTQPTSANIITPPAAGGGMERVELSEGIAIEIGNDRLIIHTPDELIEDFALSSRNRLVFDFKSALPIGSKTFKPTSPSVNTISMGFHIGYYRIVMEMAKERPYSLTREGDRLIVDLKNSPTMAQKALPADNIEMKPAAGGLLPPYSTGKMLPTSKTVRFDNGIELLFENDKIHIMTKDSVLRDFPLSEPNRIVIDFASTQKGNSMKEFPETDYVKKTSLGFHPGFYRMAFELDREHYYNLIKQDDRVTLQLK